MEEIDRNTEKNNPLVSIVVITYNSAKYVLETLESAKAQTYQNIELIVSDDCSTDNTVEICRNWIDENKDRFVRTELITVEKNTGIAPNCNRGLYKAEGEWVKFIAGDDILLNNGINKAVVFINSKLNLNIFASKEKKIINNTIQNNNNEYNNNRLLFFKCIDSNKQFKLLLKRNYITAPTVFFKKALWDNIKFNENIPNLEDYPYWIEVTKMGYYIDFLDDFTVGYRLHFESESGFETNTIFNQFYKKDFEFRKSYLFKYYSTIMKYNTCYNYYIKLVFEKLNLNNEKYRLLYILMLKINIMNYLKY